MPWPPDLSVRGALAAAAVAVLAVGCSSPRETERATIPVPTPPPTHDVPNDSHATRTPATSPDVRELIAPGRPYDAAAILAAMRESRRPGGVPQQLQTDAVAGAVAAEVWTIDGEPWTAMSIGGSCGPVRCTLELGGSRPRSADVDVWAFEVIPASGTVAVLDATLGAVPHEVVEAVDALARAREPRIQADGLLLTTARWLGPDDEDGFVLSYRSGEEEGSCELELRVDAGSGEVETDREAGC